MGPWTASDQRWQSLTPYQRAAAMSLMEADKADPDAARNALGAMINRARKSNVDLGWHVSQKIYQPTIEPAQQARLDRILRHPEFNNLTTWAQRRHAGEEADPVNGATHFLAHPKVMLALEAREPGKYKNWGPRGANWTGYNPQTGQYRNQTHADASHAFLAPEGRYEFGPPSAATTPPPSGVQTIAASALPQPTSRPQTAASMPPAARAAGSVQTAAIRPPDMPDAEPMFRIPKPKRTAALAPPQPDASWMRGVSPEMAKQMGVG